MTSESVSTVLSVHQGGHVLSLYVVPRSGKTGFDRIEQGAIRLRVTAPPVGGAANSAVITFLADTFDLAKRDIRLVSGETSQRKRILLGGLDRAEVERRLSRALTGSPA